MLTSTAISEIALVFVTDEDFDVQMNKALAIAGKEMGISRCYLFIDSEDGLTARNTHEWCADGIDPLMANLQNIPYESLSTLKEILEKGVIYPISDIKTLSADVRKTLASQGRRAIVLAPLLVGSRVRGFLGFDECAGIREWSALEINTLRIISGIIATAYSKKLLADDIAVSQKNFMNLFNTVDDIILIADTTGHILFANDGTRRKLGYTQEEIKGMHILELHPEDKKDEAARILTAMFNRELDLCPLELARKDRGRVPVETRIWFGQWNGQDCIFGISKDLSAEQSALQKFERLFKNNPAAMAVSRVDDRKIIDVNEAFIDILGYSKEETIGKTSEELALFVSTEEWQTAKADLSREGRIYNRKLILRKKEGSLIHGLFSGEKIDTQGQSLLLTVMIDITEQVKLQTNLETEQQRLANIIEGTRLGTWEWNVQTGETKFSKRWAEMIGYTLAELEPTNIETWTRTVYPEDMSEIDRLLQLHFDGLADYYECEFRMRHKNGSLVWVLDRGKVIEWDNTGKPVKMYGTHMDITDKKRMEERIRDLAIRDPLTNVYDRRYVFARLGEIITEYERRGRNFCVSILDIDHFKQVNDTYGHQAGDVVLKEFAHTVGSAIRQYDLLGRYGGEEFIIVSTSARASETAALIERIMRLVREKSYLYEGKEVRFTFSSGIADSSEFPQDACTLEGMISLADKRLYIAKEQGRNRCVIS